MTISRPFSYALAFCAAGVMSLSTGCASGGFKLTRQLATWLNGQQLILRVILYILVGFVFAVTLLVDVVIFNTMDFWEGRVSQGDYQFKDGEKLFHVQHRIAPDSQLKQSTIQVSNTSGVLVQTILMKETAKGEIELYVDGQLRSRVRDIHALPVAQIYGVDGQVAEQRPLWNAMPVESLRFLVRR